MSGHIYVASTSVLLIFTVISVAVNSNYSLDFSVTELERLAGSYWFTAQTAKIALMCSEGVLTFSRSCWMFPFNTLVCIFELNM